jgi:hypothetical protein
MNIVDLIRPKKYSEVKIGDKIMFDKDLRYSHAIPKVMGDKLYKVVDIEICSVKHPESPITCATCESYGYSIYVIDEAGFKSTQCTEKLRNAFGMYLEEG